LYFLFSVLAIPIAAVPPSLTPARVELCRILGKISTVTVTPDGRQRDIYCDQVVLGAKSTILQNKPLIWVENEAYFDDPPNRTFVESRPRSHANKTAKKPPT